MLENFHQNQTTFTVKKKKGKKEKNPCHTTYFINWSNYAFKKNFSVWLEDIYHQVYIRILPAPIIALSNTKWVWHDIINFHSMVFLLLFSITFYILLHFVKSVHFASYNFNLIANLLDALEEKMHLWKSLQKLINIDNGNKSVPNTLFLNQSVV